VAGIAPNVYPTGHPRNLAIADVAAKETKVSEPSDADVQVVPSEDTETKKNTKK
jgi:hypothetical protein